MSTVSTVGETGIRLSSTTRQRPSKAVTDVSERSNASRSDEDNVSNTDSVDQAWTENTNVPVRRMGVIQVASLVINQQIDAGFYRLPGIVLAGTGSKPLAIGLWVILGFYNFLCGFMFVEYSSAYAFTGGPLIWFDEIFYKPAMLAAMIFAWYWTLMSTTTNVQDVAIYFLVLAGSQEEVDQLSEGYLRFASVFVLTIVCLAIYFARRLCFMFMSLFALLKTTFLIVVFISGMAYAAKNYSTSGLPDFTTKHPHNEGVTMLSGLLYVSYTYQGWEHTNYIAGEIKNPRKSLRKGVFFGLIYVWILYILAVAAFYAVLPYDFIVNPPSNFDGGMIGWYFADRVFGSSQCMYVIAALSSLGSALAITYTFAKVRQAIAWQRMFPFYRFVGRQDQQFDSPGGALLVHWFFSVLQIAGTPKGSSASDFWNYLYTYGYQIELAALAIGLLWMKKRKRVDDSQWNFQTIPNRPFLYAMVVIIVGLNLLILIATSLDKVDSIRAYWMAVCMAGIVIAAVTHWALLNLLSRRTEDGRTVGQKYIGLEVKIHSCGDDESELSTTYRALMREARADGTRRRMEYKLHGRLRRTVDFIRERSGQLGRWLE